MSDTSAVAFDSTLWNRAFKRVFEEQYGINSVNSIVTPREDGYDVEHTFNAVEFYSVCVARSISSDDLITEVRQKVETELQLQLRHAPKSVKH